MKIGPTENSGRPLGPNEERRQGTETGPIPVDKFNKTDSIEISQHGRKMAEEKNAVKAQNEIEKSNTPPPAELPDLLSAYTEEALQSEIRADKVEQARERMQSGHYDSPQVKTEIARRITDDFIG
ncbi:MAG: flagellar biosynthesis anti-sigma factor FlgM [Candidatus Zixiibacteriota bacterium]